MKIVAVLSGGMDSTAAIAHARAEGHEVVHAIHFQYGSKHNGRELARATMVALHFGVPLSVVGLDFVAKHFKSDLLETGGEVPEGHYADENMKRTVVPFRNGIMLAIATGFAESLEADAVMLGNHAGDHAIYPDCRSTFTNAMSNAMLWGTYKGVKLYTPFLEMSKADIAKRGVELNVPFEITWSCYKGGAVHCGKCGTCVERIEAFRGLPDLTTYEDTKFAHAVLDGTQE